MKVLRKRVGEPLEVIETDKKYFMDCAKSFFEKGVWTERVYLDGPELIMVVDEDGLRKQLPVNFFVAFEDSPFPIQAIVGDAIFIRNKKVEYSGEIEDWEVADITEDDIIAIRNIFEPVKQSMLGWIYRGLYSK